MTGALKYEWDWTKDLAGYDDQITLCADQLDRAKYAEFLTNYLVGFTDSGYVMNLNAEWGAGKTYFLQRWHQTIKEHHPAAYVDAWKNDFSDDPLLTVISCILETLKRYPNVEAEAYSKQAIKTSGRFLKQVAPALIKGLFKTYTGVNSDSFDLDDFDDFAEKAMEASLSDHDKKSADLDEFKKIIGGWLETSINSNGADKPMFVFIDELDRCRPTYAIELLETVKHLFDIPGLVFVVATNTDQLQHSIKAVYGSEFDAQRYLYRFFNRSFTLKKPDIEKFILVQDVFKGPNGLGQTLLSTCDGRMTVKDSLTVANNLAAMAEFFEFDLRTTNQWLDQIKANFPNNDSLNVDKYFWIVSAIISGLYLYRKDIYESIFKSRLSNSREKFEEVTSSFRQRSAGYSRRILFNIKPDHLNSRTIFDHVLGNTNFDNDEIKHAKLSVNEIFTVLIDFLSKKSMEIENMSEEAARILRSDQRDRWSRNPFSVNLAMHYCAIQKGATKEGYLDLTELASDLV
jgi:hypothetical protein